MESSPGNLINCTKHLIENSSKPRAELSKKVKFIKISELEFPKNRWTQENFSEILTSSAQNDGLSKNVFLSIIAFRS